MRLVGNPNGLGKNLQEVVCRGEIDREVELAQHMLLHRDHLGFGAGVVGHVDEVFNGRWVDFMVLRSDYHSCNADQLHLVASDLSAGQVPIGEVDCDVKRFRLQFESHVDVN